MQKGVEVLLDAEHCPDGPKADPGHAMQTRAAAAEASADCNCLRDTDGINSAAVIEIPVGEFEEISPTEGNGSVHALDMATRKALERFPPPSGASS